MQWTSATTNSSKVSWTKAKHNKVKCRCTQHMVQLITQGLVAVKSKQGKLHQVKFFSCTSTWYKYSSGQQREPVQVNKVKYGNSTQVSKYTYDRFKHSWTSKHVQACFSFQFQVCECKNVMKLSSDKVNQTSK